MMPVRQIGQLEQRLRAHAAMAERLERELAKAPQLEIPIHHHFSYGVYAREMRVPAFTVIVGKIHKFQNLNIMSAGEATVLTENGVQRLRAPYTMVAAPGTKRVFYTHTPVVWTVIHGTHLTEVEKIEEVFIAQSVAEYEQFLLDTGAIKEVLPCPG